MKDIRDIRLSYELSVEHKMALEENNGKIIQFNPIQNPPEIFETKPKKLFFIYPEMPAKFNPYVDFQLLTNTRWIAEPKYNGWRIQIIKDTAGIKFYTRKGNKLNINEFENIFKEIPFDGFILDGELVIDNLKKSTNYKVSSYIRNYPDKLKIVIFDILYADYKSCMYEPLEMRKSILHELFEYIESNRIILINEVDKSYNTLEKLILSGYEGIVLKCLDGIYEIDGRINWIKVKNLRDYQLAWEMVNSNNKIMYI